jgi:hypothetical protein
MKQLERITFELNILKEAVVLVQENIAMQDIPPARGEQILGKYQTRIHHLSTSIVHQQQRQKLQQLETQRQQLMQAYRSQVTAIQQAIRDLKKTASPQDTALPTQGTMVSPTSPLETPQLNEHAQSTQRLRLRRLFHKHQ